MCKEMDKYILKADREKLKELANGHNYIYSFREAGEYTIRCLSRGAGAKPHSILAKTIKTVGVTDKNEEQKVKAANAVINRFFQDFGEDKELAQGLLMGLVGFWDKGEITGIYVTKLGEEKIKEYAHKKNEKVNIFSRNKDNLILGKEHARYLNLASKELKAGLIECYKNISILEEMPESIKNLNNMQMYLFNRLFFSGDYDMHDFFVAGKTMTSTLDMHEITKIQEELYVARQTQITNWILSEIEGNKQKLKETLATKLQEEHESDYYRVQHGPQYNYIAQMINDNDEILKMCKDEMTGKIMHNYFNTIVDVVADASFSLLAYKRVEKGSDEAGWRIIQNKDELNQMYADCGMHMKETWLNPFEIKTHKNFILKQLLIAYMDMHKKKRISWGEELAADIKAKKGQSNGGTIKEAIAEEMKECINDVLEKYKQNPQVFEAAYGEEYSECLVRAYEDFFGIKVVNK